jgi:hypothetical protein
MGVARSVTLGRVARDMGGVGGVKVEHCVRLAVGIRCEGSGRVESGVELRIATLFNGGGMPIDV